MIDGKNSSSEWQLQVAKARFSQVVNSAVENGPQLVTKGGVPAVYVVSADLFETELASKVKDRKSILLSSPHSGLHLDLQRESSEGRDVEL